MTWIQVGFATSLAATFTFGRLGHDGLALIFVLVGGAFATAVAFKLQAHTKAEAGEGTALERIKAVPIFSAALFAGAIATLLLLFDALT